MYNRGFVVYSPLSSGYNVLMARLEKKTIAKTQAEQVDLSLLETRKTYRANDNFSVGSKKFRVLKAWNQRDLGATVSSEAFDELYDASVIAGYWVDEHETHCEFGIYEFTDGSFSEPKPTGFYNLEYRQDRDSART